MITTPNLFTTINPNELTFDDKVLVSVCSFGREIASIQLNGFNNVQDILASLAEKFCNVGGLLTVRLRNPRCGWTSKHTIRTSRQCSSLLASA